MDDVHSQSECAGGHCAEAESAEGGRALGHVAGGAGVGEVVQLWGPANKVPVEGTDSKLCSTVS